MSEFLATIGGWAIMTGVLAAAFAGLWVAFGRRKRGEDKAIGILRQMAMFRGTVWPTNVSRHK